MRLFRNLVIAQGTKYPPGGTVLRTGGWLPLVTSSQPFQIASNLLPAELFFEFGFGSDETLLPGEIELMLATLFGSVWTAKTQAKSLTLHGIIVELKSVTSEAGYPRLMRLVRAAGNWNVEVLLANKSIRVFNSGGMSFPTTHWSLLAKATLEGAAEGRAALEELCRRYWSPLNQFIQSRGYAAHEAEDLTQEFLLHLLGKEAFRKPDRLRGKFRSFLLGALVKFLSHERERRLAQKRGGQQPHLSVELIEENEGLSGPPADRDIAVFDRAWALTAVRTALHSVERDYAGAGKAGVFAVLREFLPGAHVPPSYEQAAARAEMSVAAFNSETHRFRQQFREALRAEVMATVSAPHEIEEEITHLYRVLMDRGTDFAPPRES